MTRDDLIQKAAREIVSALFGELERFNPDYRETERKFQDENIARLIPVLTRHFGEQRVGVTMLTCAQPVRVHDTAGITVCRLLDADVRHNDRSNPLYHPFVVRKDGELVAPHATPQTSSSPDVTKMEPCDLPSGHGGWLVCPVHYRELGLGPLVRRAAASPRVDWFPEVRHIVDQGNEHLRAGRLREAIASFVVAGFTHAELKARLASPRVEEPRDQDFALAWLTDLVYEGNGAALFAATERVNVGFLIDRGAGENKKVLGSGDEAIDALIDAWKRSGSPISAEARVEEKVKGP